jgi:hypothetical protein
MGLGAAAIGKRGSVGHLTQAAGRWRACCSRRELGERTAIGAPVTASPAVVNADGPHAFSLLYHAAISGDTGMAELLAPHLKNRTWDFNQSLSAAVRDGNLAMTRWLLNNGVTDPNLADGLGKRPLTTALAKGFVEIAEELRKHGATE